MEEKVKLYLDLWEKLWQETLVNPLIHTTFKKEPQKELSSKGEGM